MSDPLTDPAVIVAVCTAVPATIAAIASLRNGKRTEAIKENLGTKNGKGSVVQMNEAMLELLAEHVNDDARRFDANDRRMASQAAVLDEISAKLDEVI